MAAGLANQQQIVYFKSIEKSQDGSQHSVNSVLVLNQLDNQHDSVNRT